MELTVKGICKSFGAGNVLEQVDFSIRGGEICALLGENGAGKSTLMNIIGGVYRADRGEILIDGKRTEFLSPADALKAGIGFIHQELNLVGDLTVCENLFLSGFPRKGIFLDKKEMLSQAKALLDSLDMELDPEKKVRELSVSCQQMVEIARTFLQNASVIIMDEPTSSLTYDEIERMFEIMKTLKQRGVAMIFISHKLDEVMRICDRYVVLRNGTLVGNGKTADTSPEALASMMIGHTVGAKHIHTRQTFGEELLRLEKLSDGKRFFDCSLSVERGEVLGVTGLLGDGRSELFETVFGIHGGGYTGKILLDGKEIHPTQTHEALKYGLAYLPGNRKQNAVLTGMSIVDNGTAATLSSFQQMGLLDRNAQKKALRKQAKDLCIRMNGEEDAIETLSGGNQQKVILAKWLLSNPRVLILNNPTQGVDVGVKEEIYTVIEGLAKSGIAVIVLAPEPKEILCVCDRALVMYHGRIAASLSGEEMNEKNMVLYATGVGKETNT